MTVMNMKGGVGKTTVALNVAGILSRYIIGGKNPLKVLLIDYDPQFNLSQAYLAAKQYFQIESDGRTTLSILLDDGTKLDPYKLQVPGNHNPPTVASLVTSISNTGDGKLDIIPSTLNLMYVALGQANSAVTPIEERFRKFIDECRTLYDLVIVDCHPAGSLFTKTSLNNSDFVLIPVVPEKYAVRGIGLMLEFIKTKKTGAKSPTPMILFNSVPRNHVLIAEATIRSDSEYAPYCLSNSMKWYKAFGEPEGGRGFVWQSKKPYSNQAFHNLLAVSREIRTKLSL